MESRKIYNPVQKDYVTFLKTADETDGEYTLVEVELADGGGVGWHYHKTYSEKFDCVSGEVQIGLGKKIKTLQTGESALAEANVNHLFRNRSGKPCTFRVELRPASRGFEKSLQIGYGLRRMVCADRMVFRKINSHSLGCSILVKATYRVG